MNAKEPPVMIVNAHPEEKSFCSLLAVGMREVFQDSCSFHTLYKENFPPLLSPQEYRRQFPLDELSQKHIRVLSKASYLIIVYPIWWMMPPAILKGWLDRILLPGVAFDKEDDNFESYTVVGRLKHLKVLICCTASGSLQTKMQDPKNLWEDIFSYCGISHIRYMLCDNLQKINLREKRAFYRSVIEICDEIQEKIHSNSNVSK